jgi:alpha-L-rhamnosidase
MSRSPSSLITRVATAWFLATTLVPLLAAPTVENLRCESRVDPQGIDTVQPRLSWQIDSDARGVLQTAYQILLATSEDKLKEGIADLGDSGKVNSSQSILVPYAGKALTSHVECFWKVRVWTSDDKPSAWSKPAHWSMGILNPAEWHAKWIGFDGVEKTNFLTGTSWIGYPEGNPVEAAPPGTNWFRRVVTIPKDRTITRAIFEYTGDNEGRGWINIFDLGARDNPRRVKWNDITTRLESGQTYVFGLVGVNKGEAPNPAGVVGLLTIEFATGEPMVIRTDESWKVSKTFERDWNTVGFDDSKWTRAKVLVPVGANPWGDITTAEDRRHPARWLRKEFTAEKKIKRATVSVAGLGLSEVYLNGQKVGDHVLSPALSQYDKRVFYVTHDVTKQLRSGANAIGAVLGGGRFYSDRSKVYSGTINAGWPKLLLQLRIEHTDGSVAEVVSDESWQLTTDGPLRGDGEFDGEEYDARMELGDWSRAGYDVGQAYQPALRRQPQWQSAQLVSTPAPTLSAQRQEPIRVTGTLKPIKLSEPRPGVFIFDLGQNMVGWCRLKVSGSAGTRVQLRHAETLRDDGTLYMANLRGARVTDSYTLKGRGTETYEPRFTYHGFRFVEVTGFPGKPTLASIEGRVVNDDLPVAGEFACSNELLNQIYRNVVWGTRGNYRSIPTDCPQRDERQGWLGDRSEECRGESYLFDMSQLYAKWMQDISDAQRPNGSVPDVAPAYWPLYKDNVTWPSTFIIAPSVLHRQFGDLGPIADHYQGMKRWLQLMHGYFTNGVIARDNYGDWCVPPEDLGLIHSKDPARQTDKTVLATSYYYYDMKLAERYARLLGKPDEAAKLAKWADDVKTAFNDKFLDPEKGYYDNGSQTACVLPLAFGLVPDDMRARVFARLVDKIENETKGHIGTGLIGGQYLMRVLSDNGRADLAYTIATQKDYPGWGYMVGQGATTIWELWNGNTADPTMNSGNHVMLVGDLVIWLNEYLAGIAADPEQPGFKHIVMKPHPVGDLTHVKATHRSPYGEIASEWRKDGGKFIWEVEIPANTTATVTLPTGRFDRTTLNGQPLVISRDIRVVDISGTMRTDLGSGKYRFVCE